MILLCVLITAAFGAQITFYLIHARRISTVRASSASTLVFSLAVTLLPISFVPALQAAFFGATFVGMTDRSRMGKKRVLLASLVFGLIFTFLIPLFKGIGGGLGAAAFLSSSVSYFFGKLLKKKEPS